MGYDPYTADSPKVGLKSNENLKNHSARTMKYVLLTVFMLAVIPLNRGMDLSLSGTENSHAILKKSRDVHDPQGEWNKVRLSLHIQEPRPQTPKRYSELQLDQQSGAFVLSRTYEPGVIERIITAEGVSKILLNGSTDIPESIRAEYRLSEESNFGYRNFYRALYGLPMSFTEELWVQLEEVVKVQFDDQPVYKIRAELKEPMISKFWELYISVEDYRMEALRFDRADEERPDELIVFNGSFDIEGMSIPRFRNWYYYESREYLGSDVIVKSLGE